MRLSLAALLIALSSCVPAMSEVDAGDSADAGQETCPGQHSDGDQAEPDECPALARLIRPGAPALRTLTPQADQDWFRVEADAMHAYRFSANGMLAYIWIFDAQGMELATQVGSAVFVAPEQMTLFVRVQAVREGAYSALLEDLGLDDFPNNAWEAAQLPLPTIFAGRLGYAGDVDAAWIEIPALTTIDFRTVSGNGRFELRRADGSIHEILSGVSEISTSIPERVLLRSSAPDSQSTGWFQVEITVFGTDDHADDPALATSIVANGRSIPVSGLTAGDVDFLAGTQLEGHLYNVRATGSVNEVTVLDSSGSELTSDRSGPPRVWRAMRSEPILIKVRCGFACSISLDDLVADDHADVAALATPFLWPGTLTGRLELPADRDVFTIPALAGHLTRMTSSDSTVFLEVRDLQSNVRSSGLGSVSLVPSMNETFTVFVQRAANASTGLIRYQLTLEDLGREDHGDTPATATAITIGTPTAGAIDFRYDVDLFAVPVMPGHIYRASSTPSYWLGVVNANGMRVAGGAPVLFHAATTEPRFIELYGAAGSYSLLVEDLGFDDHPDTRLAATPVSVGTPVTGWTQYVGDRDTFRAPVIAGHRYSVTCTHPVGCILEGWAVASDGAVTAWGPFTTNTAFLAAANQTEVVVSAVSDVAAPYSLLVADLGLDDHPDTPELATTELVVGGPAVTGNAEAFDLDVFFVDAAAGQVIALTCTESTSSGCHLTIQAQSGLPMYSHSPNVTPGVVTSGFFSSSAERWTVSVSSSAARLDYSLTATLSADDSTAPRPLTLGSPVAGSIDYLGDTDDFDVQLAQGIEVTATLTPGIEAQVYSSSGALLRVMYDGSTYQPPASGLYRLKVVGQVSRTFSYSLTLQ